MNCFTNEDELPSGATSQPSKSSLPGLKKQVRHNLLLAVRGVKKGVAKADELATSIKGVFKPKHEEKKDADKDVSAKDLYYNLDPSLEKDSGLDRTIMSLKAWTAFSTFCRESSISQGDLERFYQRFWKPLQPIEEADEEAQKPKNKFKERKVQTISQETFMRVFKYGEGNNLFAIVARKICSKESTSPGTPDQVAKGLEVGFARFVIQSYNMCILSEDLFVEYFLKAFMDAKDVDNYRDIRTRRHQNPVMTHSEFFELLLELHPDMPSYLLHISDLIKFNNSNDISSNNSNNNNNTYSNNEMDLRTLMYHMYMYPTIMFPALYILKAVRRRVFGEAFWKKRLEQDQLTPTEIFQSLSLPSSLSGLFSRITSKKEAIRLSVRNLIRYQYFDGNIDLILGPKGMKKNNTIVKTLRNLYGYRDAEFLIRKGLSSEEGGGGREPGIPSDEYLESQILKEGWIKILDKKHGVHFFYNNYTGASQYEVPRWSKFFRVFREENKNHVRLEDRKIKVRTISKKVWKKEEMKRRQKDQSKVGAIA